MFLKKYLKHIVAIILIFFIALGSSFLIKSEFFSKRSLIVEYKYKNYYLSSPHFIHGYLRIVEPILFSDQFSIRDEVVNSEGCEFLDKEVNSFTIVNRPHKKYRAEIFSNKRIKDKDLDVCFNSFLSAMENRKNDIFKRILNSDIELLEGSLKYYENMLNDQDLFEKKFESIDIVLRAKKDREEVFYIKRFLNHVNKTNVIYILNKKYLSYSLSQRVIFIALFVSFVVIYLIYLNFFINRKLITKIFG